MLFVNRHVVVRNTCPYNGHGLIWLINTQAQPTTNVERSVEVAQTFL